MTVRRGLSLGGDVVAQSLAAVGADLSKRTTSLVETTMSASRPAVVLVQSAWNIIPDAEFESRVAPYPSAMRMRMRLRRKIAAVNLRRAKHVVVLTYAMRDLLQSGFGIDAMVAPVTAPLDVFPEASEPVAEASARASYLVPGTVSWYKAPLTALDFVSKEHGRGGRLVFAGKDDGSGAWDAARRRASELGLMVSRVTYPRSELYTQMQLCGTTILPSRLESLGFAVAEAGLVAPRLVVSPIAAHMEVVSRLGRSVEWLDGVQRKANQAHYDRAVCREEWTVAAAALRLI